MTAINRIQAILSWCETKSNVHEFKCPFFVFLSLSLSLSLALFISSFNVLLIYLLETFFCCVLFLCRRCRRRCHQIFFSALYLVFMLEEHFHISDDASSANHLIALKCNKIRVENPIWIFIDNWLDSNDRIDPYVKCFFYVFCLFFVLRFFLWLCTAN